MGTPVLAINLAHAVREPKHVVKRGKTLVLTREKATLRDGSEAEVPWLVGLPDRALTRIIHRDHRLAAG